MAEAAARIVELPEGQRQHVWWDTERHFPFMTMERGWKFCPYCGGFKFKEGEKFLFPTLPKSEKGEEVPVAQDIGCKNFKPQKKIEIVKEPEKKGPEEKIEEMRLVEKKEEKPTESPPAKKKGFLKGFRK